MTSNGKEIARSRARPPTSSSLYILILKFRYGALALLPDFAKNCSPLSHSRTNEQTNLISSGVRAEMKTTKAAVAAMRRRQRRRVPVCTCTAATLLALLLLPIFCVERAQAVRVQQQQQQQNSAEFGIFDEVFLLCRLRLAAQTREGQGHGRLVLRA